MRTLLLGLALSAGPVSAADIPAPTDRTGAGANMTNPAPVGAGAASQARSGAKKVRGNKGKGAADTEGTPKKGNARRGSGAGEAEDMAPAAEPQPVALRGVRG